MNLYHLYLSHSFNVFSLIVIFIFSSQNVINFKVMFPNLISLLNNLIFFLFPYHANLSLLLDRFPFFFPMLSPFLLFISIAKNGVSSSSISPFSFQLFLHSFVSVVYRIWRLISKRGKRSSESGFLWSNKESNLFKYSVYYFFLFRLWASLAQMYLIFITKYVPLRGNNSR